MSVDPHAGHPTLRRKPWLVRAWMPLLACIARCHRIRVEGTDRLPREGPALLLVKHRATRDTLLLAWLLHRHTGRTANYVMKQGAAGLPPRLMEAFGGVPVIRAKDVLRQLFSLEATSPLTVPIIPIGTVYAHPNCLCSQATFRVGSLQHARDYPSSSAMMAALRAQLAALSGLTGAPTASSAT